MIGLCKAISLFLLSGCLASAATLDARDAEQSSCSDGKITKHREYTKPSDDSELVWDGIFGGEDGFLLSRQVVTTVNSTTTFPRYTNLLDIVRANTKYPVQWSSSTNEPIDVHIPPHQGGAVYFTGTLICFDGKLTCGGKDENGTFCSVFWAGGTEVYSGTPGFVSQVGANTAMNHAKSTGHRVGITPKQLKSQEKSDNHDNSAARKHVDTAAKLLSSSVLISLLWL